jgi:uncharacterized protein YyaL (SSP411 family)
VICAATGRIKLWRWSADRPTAIPLLLDRPVIDHRPTAYVCVHFACQRPTTDPQVLAEQLA